MSRKLLSLMLALLLCVLAPTAVRAEEVQERSPLQGDTVSLTVSSEPAQVLLAEEVLSVEDAAIELRRQMVARQEVCEILVRGVSSSYEDTLDAVIEQVLVHTGSPKEGDYLAWQVEGYSGEVYDESDDQGYVFHYKLEMYYYTTAAQEAELDDAVEALLSDLGVSSMTDYQKVKAVYDYMIQNITYDEAHLEDDSYLLQYTAYAALVNKTAVCQGYSNLLYRLLLEMGIDCRIIAGEVENGGHAWNICRLGSVYYNLDATWDAGYDDYAYFLRNSEGFADHYRYLEYATTQFHTDYPMSATDYEEGVEGEPEDVYVYGQCGDDAYWGVDRDGVLIIAGTGATWNYTSPQYEGDHVPWIYWLDGFDSVVVDEGITVIGECNFSGVSNIRQVVLADSVTELEMWAFDACESLTDIDLGQGLEIIGDCVFRDCAALTSLEFPESLVSIGADSFFECESLEKLTFPGALAVIGNYAFYNCTELTEFTFTGDAPEIGEESFELVTATAYYPGENVTWTEDMLQDYGGELTWVSTHTHDFTDVEPEFDPDTRTHSYDCLTCDSSVQEDCSFACTVTRDATVSASGIREYTCTLCGGSYEEQFMLRLAGENRYETAFATANTLKEQLGVEEFENIIVANGRAFADALAGSYLAVVKNAPILLVNESRMEAVAEYILENLAEDGTVYLLGGEGAVPEEMEALLDQVNVTRLAGRNRYITNLAILEEAGYADQEILVCTGTGFADSLSASAVGKPILLVNKSFSDEQIEFLESCSGKFIIVGGEGAVSAELEEALAEYGQVERLGGGNRYETCVLVAERFFDSPESAVLAYSLNFPDGLCGGPLAYRLGGPLLLMATGKGSAVVEYANETGIQTGAILGGTSLIDDETANKVFSVQ